MCEKLLGLIVYHAICLIHCVFVCVSGCYKLYDVNTEHVSRQWRPGWKQATGDTHTHTHWDVPDMWLLDSDWPTFSLCCDLVSSLFIISSRTLCMMWDASWITAVNYVTPHVLPLMEETRWLCQNTHPAFCMEIFRIHLRNIIISEQAEEFRALPGNTQSLVRHPGYDTHFQAFWKLGALSSPTSPRVCTGSVCLLWIV